MKPTATRAALRRYEEMAADPHPPDDSTSADLGLRDLLRRRVDRIMRALREGDRQQRIHRPKLEDLIRARERERGFHWFDRVGIAGDLERRTVLAYLLRSTAELAPANPGKPDRRRSVYQVTITAPSGARRADLRQATRAAMAALEAISGPLPPWIATEKPLPRPHVHLVIPALREVAPGDFKHLAMGERQIAAMREAVDGEIAHQLEAFHLPTSILGVSRSSGSSLLEGDGRKTEPAPSSTAARGENRPGADRRQRSERSDRQRDLER